MTTGGGVASRCTIRLVLLRASVCLTIVGCVAIHSTALIRAQGDKLPVPRKTTPTRVIAPVKPASARFGALVVTHTAVKARVKLLLKGTHDDYHTVTPKFAFTDGTHTYDSLNPGSYRVEITSPNYELFSDDVRITAGQTSTLEAHMVATFGFVELAGPDLTSGVLVELDGIRVPDSTIERLKDDTLKIQTSRGTHRIRVSRDGFVPFEATAEVGPEAHEMVAVILERKRASLTVRSTPGVRVYADGVQRATVPTSGEVHIDGLTPDRAATVRLELDDYEPFETSLVLVADHENVVAHDLTLLPSSAEFSDTFLGGLSLWDCPQSWTADRGVLRVSGAPGTGFPKGLRFRDCDIRFGLRLDSLQGAAWMVRARDERNGYLFVLSGPESKWPNQLRTFTVRDGVVDLNTPSVSPLPVPVVLNTHDTYRIRVSLRGSVIQHWLTPSSTGEELSIGLFDDKDATFLTGNVGFAVVDREDFSINGLVVTPVPR